MCTDCIQHRLTRRGLMLGSAAGLAASLLPGLSAAAAETPAAPNSIPPDEALKRLMDGNARYAGNTSTNIDYSAGRAARAQGQYPFASIVSCSDSRVAPEILFDQGPGELFIVRVAGNFVNEDGLASLEYGALVLGSPLILVLGHTSCGAVDATIKVVKEGNKLPGHLPSLVDAIRPSVEAAIAEKPTDLLAAATIENVRDNVEYLKKDQPVLSDMMKSGKVNVVGGIYELATGKVSLI
jgi:carbonic anhydrase